MRANFEPNGKNRWWNGLDRRTLLKAGAAGIAGSTFVTNASAKSIDVGNRDGADDTDTNADEWEFLSLREQLKAVRKATKQYKDLAAVDRDGYVSAALPLICGAGYHFDKERLWERPPEPERPGSLFYLVENGTLRLGGAEYLFVTDLDDDGDPIDPMPDLFTDEDEPTEGKPLSGTTEADGWELIEDPATGSVVWDLHVWVHEENPKGIFHTQNPRFEGMPGCVPLEDLV